MNGLIIGTIVGYLAGILIAGIMNANAGIVLEENKALSAERIKCRFYERKKRKEDTEDYISLSEAISIVEDELIM